MKSISVGPLSTSVDNVRLFKPDGNIHLEAVSSLFNWSHNISADAVIFSSAGYFCNKQISFLAQLSQRCFSIGRWWTKVTNCRFPMKFRRWLRFDYDSSEFNSDGWLPYWQLCHKPYCSLVHTVNCGYHFSYISYYRLFQTEK